MPSAERIHPDLPDGVDEVLVRALAKDPADRPESCGALVADLEAAFDRASAPTRIAAAPVRADASETGQPTRPLPRSPGRVHRSSPRFRRLVPAAVGLLVAGLLLAALLGPFRDSGRSAQPPATTNETTRPATTEATQPPADTTVASDPVELNDRGFALMQEGEYGRARPLLDRAVAGLAGTGAITEAYASYNLAFTRFALGSCDGVLSLLDRSEAVQGERSDIDELREGWEDRCLDEDGKGDRGKGNGRRKDDED